ncbi:MAG: hypothetical protein EZS28_052339 [Streblomastix strix]|uniref:Uncharacterized protein n=1 Tax=Streblomastix strix TaxID=222440 RepID=A0A5J4SAH5_9EUKA|nr:MAG: hypothetical protein EZS28_052339 [Streblomastix strix]
MPTADRMVTTLTSIGIDHGNPSKLKYPPVNSYHKKKILSWVDIPQLFPHVSRESVTKMEAFDLPFPSETILTFIYAPSVHSYFISTSECKLYVLNEEGECVSPAGR